MERRIKVGDVLYAEDPAHGAVMTVIKVSNGIATVVYPDGFIDHEYCKLVRKPFTPEEREKIRKGIPVY